MAITINAEDRVQDAFADEEVYLPGRTAQHDPEGPYDFTYPRLGRLLRAQRRLKGLDPLKAAAEEVEGMLDWLAVGFGRDAWHHIEERLADDDDVLDEEHLVKLFQLLNEKDTGRPTTSSSGASRQPWKNTRPAAPSPQESVSQN